MGRDGRLPCHPTFSGRMRAGLHVPTDSEVAGDRTGPSSADRHAVVTTPRTTAEGSGDQSTDSSQSPVHVTATELLTDGAPAYPRPAGTDDELRLNSDVEYIVGRHRARHERALEQWPDAVPENVVDRARLQLPRGELLVDVTVLGEATG